MQPPRDILKIITLIIVAAFFIWSNSDPYKHGFMHLINFPIHEIGHVLFGCGYFGKFICVAGGSIFQIIVPIFFCGYFFTHEQNYFFTHEQKFSAALTLFWVGNNFFDVAVYADDAIFMELPLWSFSGNEGTTIHDWNYLLTETSMIPHTHLIAGIIRAIGVIITIAAIIASFHFARKREIFIEDEMPKLF